MRSRTMLLWLLCGGCVVATGLDDLEFLDESLETFPLGGNGGTGGAGGSPLPIGDCASIAVDAQAYLDDVEIWTTLDDEVSVASPLKGAAGMVRGNVSFVPTEDGGHLDVPFETSGVELPFESSNFAPVRGVVDFCYFPEYPVIDDVWHPLFRIDYGDGAGGNNPGSMSVRVQGALGDPYQTCMGGSGGTGGNTGGGGTGGLSPGHVLQLHAVDAAGRDANYYQLDHMLTPSMWQRVTVRWDFSDAVDTVQIFINGVEVPLDVAVDGVGLVPTLVEGAAFDLGYSASSCWNAAAKFDELVLYKSSTLPWER